MLGDHLLDLGGIDVEAADDDEVLGPVDEVQVAVVVGHGDVAGAQPAVGGQHPGGLLGIVEVALEHVGALHPDLAGVAAQHVVAVSSTSRTSMPSSTLPTEPTFIGSPAELVTTGDASVSP